jgi:DNA-binding winged helix-turn-helix (wHTH) protein
MDVLILLVERRRQLVSRADIVERLWGKDVFVDVETGVHTAIRKTRQALGDSISTPAFVETIPSKGYRFVADVEVVSRGSDSPVPIRHVEPSPTQGRQQPNGIRTGKLDDHDSTQTAAGAAAPAVGSEPARSTQSRGVNPARLLIALVTVTMVANFVAWTRLPWGAPAAPITIAVLPFEYLGSDSEREYLAAGLTEETSASLARSISSASSSREAR